MQPKISVIIPVYNVENYLKKSVDSVLNQTLIDIEVILIDDGSSDNSPSICDDYKAKDSRVKVIHKENAGVSSARNDGLKIATGQFVTFVDSDDFIAPYMYEKMYNSAMKNNADMTICNFVKTDGKGVVNFEEDSSKEEIYDAKGAFELIADFSLPIQVTVWNKIYRKNIVDNLYFDTNKIMAEDLEFLMKAVFKCSKVSYLPIAMYGYYAQREGAATFIKNKSVDWYLQQNDNIAQIMDDVANNNTEVRDLAIAYKCVNGDLSVANAMIKLNSNDKKVISFLKKELRDNFKTVRKSKLNRKKKIQILLYIISPKLYKMVVSKMI